MNVDSELINQFLTGTISVFLMVLIGGSLAQMFRSISRRFTFTKTALIIALPPLCFSLCLDRGGLSTVYLFDIVIVLLGYLIDGIRYLLLAGRDDENHPKQAVAKAGSEPAERQVTWERVE